MHSSFCLLVFEPLPLSASGVPKKNGDRHASEICLAALSLRDACQIIDRPDMRNRTIEIRPDTPHTNGVRITIWITELQDNTSGWLRPHVDLGLGSSRSLWAAMEATCGPGRMAEHPKLLEGIFYCPDALHCTMSACLESRDCSESH